MTIHRGVEQLAARRAHNPEVGGSSPPPATIEEIQIGFPLFFMVAGGGLMSSTIFTIPPNLPLIREACGKAAPCIATQSYILDALNYTPVILNKWVRNFDAVSYHRGNPNRISSFFMVAGGGLMSSVISTIHPNPPLIRRAYGKTLSCIALQSETQPHSRG